MFRFGRRTTQQGERQCGRMHAGLLRRPDVRRVAMERGGEKCPSAAMLFVSTCSLITSLVVMTLYYSVSHQYYNCCA